MLMNPSLTLEQACAAGIAHGDRMLSKHGPHATEAFERVVRVNLLCAFNVLVEESWLGRSRGRRGSAA